MISANTVMRRAEEVPVPSKIPNLPHSCGSWVVVNTETGKAVVEIFERSTAECVNFKKYHLVTTLEWLQSFNYLPR